MFLQERHIYERRFVILTHRKGREERKAENENINRSMGKIWKLYEQRTVPN